MHPDDVAGDGLVRGGVALVEDDEEEVEAGHDGRGDGHVRLERLGAVVPADFVGVCVYVWVCVDRWCAGLVFLCVCVRGWGGRE